MNYSRIKTKDEFSKLFKKGKRIFSPSLTLIYFPSQVNKMGIVVSKKHGKSVTRNRIKRLLREVFKKNLPMAEKTYSFIIMPRPAEEYTFKTFEKSIIICFKKLNLCEDSKKG